MKRPIIPPRTCAAYLRCYPRDDWAMMGLCRALEEYALVLGLPNPVAYIDNGCPSRRPGPCRTELDTAVAAGRINVVLVPGPWVFALDDAASRRAVEEFAAQGCQVVELPRVRATAPRVACTNLWDARPVRPRPCPPVRDQALGPHSLQDTSP